jgi:transcriptional regulator NrdR family protein
VGHDIAKAAGERASKSERLVCPVCESQTRIIETRQLELGLLRRRRVCDQGHRFSSWELADARFCRKRAGWLQRFDEAKLRRAIAKAAEGIAVNEDRIVRDVVRSMLDAPGMTGDAISTEEIGRIILRGLNEEDPTGVCMVRFGSVFLRRHFNSPDELLAGIRSEIEQPMLYVVKRRAELGIEDRSDERPLVQPFSYTKLRRSIRRALQKTPHQGKLEVLVNAVADLASREAEEVALEDNQARSEIEAERIGRLVLDQLRHLDWAAYVRYLSVFDREAFQKEVPKARIG